MDTKLFARIGAIAFVAVAITMTALELREEPRSAEPEVITVFEPDSDPLPDVLRQCAAMGEAATSSRICLHAWAEKRRRFLGDPRRGEPPPAESAAPATPSPALSPALQEGQ